MTDVINKLGIVMSELKLSKEEAISFMGLGIVVVCTNSLNHHLMIKKAEDKDYFYKYITPPNCMGYMSFDQISAFTDYRIEYLEQLFEMPI